MTRIDKSIVIGAGLSAVLVAFGDKFRHAGMVAQAAKQHESVPGFLLIAFMGLTLLIIPIVHVLGSSRHATG